MSPTALALNSVQHEDHSSLIGLARLMAMAFRGEDLSGLGQQLLARAGLDDAAAMMDLCTLLQLRGDPATALALQPHALELQRHYPLLPDRQASPIRLLAIMAAGDLMTNVPLEFLAQGAGFRLDLLYLTPGQPLPAELPEHDLAIVALSELDRNLPTLHWLEAVLADWPRPLLNRPQAVAKMGRDRISRTLQALPGVSMPLTVRLDRATLARIAAGEEALANYLSDGDLPAIIRPVDSHAGKGLCKLESAADLAAYLQNQPEAEFFVARFVDYRSRDGQFRKYRVMMINGRPYLGHMAISDHWMVHYLNAGMTESADKRAEEAAVMRTFDQGFARRHARALAAIQQQLGVEYFGMDCAETRGGQLLIFEAGTAMSAHAMDPVDLFPYKQPPMRKLFNGFLQMLEHRLKEDSGLQRMGQILPFNAARGERQVRPGL
ncbi:ATP-grasp domain-containing protein [Marinobacterium arenosum]|uniref:ATP-grasp domain-containing protein n=1 Tax=Marinobacterium arenosum TaxID=2862496 RepID=UPI001C9448B2|nr:hypothetical protein [Marinobacterium arenosum]MBY4677024.1 hypothetical protein [Marinobacterium arenosum]